MSAKFIERQQQGHVAVQKFTTAARSACGTDSYAAGYLSSTLVNLAASSLTKHAFAEFLAHMAQAEATQLGRITVDN